MLNSAVISNPITLVVHGTTYVSIGDILDLLSRLGIHADWTGKTLYLSTARTHPNPIPILPRNGVTGGIYVNGSRVAEVTARAFQDPKLGMTVALPLLEMMHVLRAIGLWTTWNGQIWGVLTQFGHPPFVSMHSASDFFTPAATFTMHPNATRTARIENDSNEWWHSDSRTYLEAEQPDGSPMLDLQPNQPVLVCAYTGTENLPTKAQWFVNSPDAHFIPPKTSYSINGFRVASVLFVANAPGVYTVQAKTISLHSIPLVIVVGLDHLPYHPMHRDASVTGIRPLPKTLPSVAPASVTDFTYRPYSPQSGWLPIQGTAKPGTGSVDISLMDLSETANNLTNNPAFWAYQIPVRPSGKFSAMVRLPFKGNLTVTMQPDPFYDADQTRNNAPAPANGDITAEYTVYNGVPTDINQRSLYASNFMDYNMNAALVRTAQTLAENAGSRAAAVQAIANYAAERVWYDWPEIMDHKIGLQVESANGVWNNPAGTFYEVDSLTGAMLRAAGIPTQSFMGHASDYTGKYMWLSVPLGSEKAMYSHEIPFDPAMSTIAIDGVTTIISNEYFGSGRLQDTHPANGMPYTYFPGVY